MPKTDKRIDAYIDNAADFAQPILTRVRQLVHEACPDVEETLKWGHPSFMYHGIMCGMASFKEYCAFHFWKGALIIENSASDQMWGQLGRLAKVSNLPPKKVLVGYVKKAMELNEEGTKVPRRAVKPKKELVMPEQFMAAIKKNKKALAGFEAFSPSNKRDYIEWITEAKGEDTRDRRIAQAVEWMAEGKPRNWKYM
jgi:uncharacterized protein YdeI (YjbR/CyaY-like superfamily)